MHSVFLDPVAALTRVEHEIDAAEIVWGRHGLSDVSTGSTALDTCEPSDLADVLVAAARDLQDAHRELEIRREQIAVLLESVRLLKEERDCARRHNHSLVADVRAMRRAAA